MPHHPFSDAQLRDFLEGYLETILQKIRGLSTEYVLKASATELESHFIQEARIEPLILHMDQMTLGSQTGVDVDVSREFDRAVMPGDNPYVRGTLLRFDVPYEGTRELLRYRPYAFASFSLPKVDIADDHISFYHQFPDDSPRPDHLRAEIDRDKKALQQTVDGVAQQVNEYNATMPAKIKQAVDVRIRNARQTSDVVEGLGVPLKRTATPPAYAVPLTRRPSPRALPPVETKPYKSEPFLRFDDYEHILGVTKSMGLAMERAAESFSMMDEEDIRNHFLLQLNGHYEGSASGETFNAGGKTDILIRVNDKNIFIAECKFWGGEQTFQDAIDQLLGYLTWRDSKCALFIFNQNRNTTAVAHKMHEVMQARPECKKYVGPDARGDHRYTLVKPSEPGREITITTQLFDVPRSATSTPASAPKRSKANRGTS